MMTISAVDVGVKNFAYVTVRVNGGQQKNAYDIVNTDRLCKVNLQDFDDCQDVNCPIERHAKDATTRLAHLKLHHPELFKSDCVVIEQQPLVGMKDVEQVLAALCEKQVVVLSPRTMHKHYHINHLDYEGRKKWVVANMLPRFLSSYEMKLKHGERLHDVADACALLCCHLCRLQKETDEARLLKEMLARNLEQLPLNKTLGDFLEECRYKPRKTV